MMVKEMVNLALPNYFKHPYQILSVFINVQLTVRDKSIVRTSPFLAATF